MQGTAIVKPIGRILILGAGPCGLGAAYRLHELGIDDFAIFERYPQVGGIAASICDDRDFVWDYGCHLVYSRSQYFNQVMDKLLAGELTQQTRDAQVWMFGRYVPYPVQYNIHRLPADVRRECVLGLARAAIRPKDSADGNFMEWITSSFGLGIARHFMIPYNEKVWATPLETMNVAWTADRVPRPDLVRVLSNLLDGKDDPTWGGNARFCYPREGGIGAMWRRVAQAVGPRHISLGRTAVGIDTKRRRVTFADGGEDDYETLISTIPINHLVELSDLHRLKPAAEALAASNVHVVGVGMEGDVPSDLADRRWIYFPDHRVPFYRMTVLSNFAPTNAPPGHWSVLAEVAHSSHRPIDCRTIVQDVVASAHQERLIPSGQPVVSQFHHVIAPGYPTPTRVRDSALGVLLPALESVGIYSRGRFGVWRYEISNQDHAFLQGAELIGRLMLGTAESVLASR